MLTLRTGARTIFGVIIFQDFAALSSLQNDAFDLQTSRSVRGVLTNVKRPYKIQLYELSMAIDKLVRKNVTTKHFSQPTRQGDLQWRKAKNVFKTLFPIIAATRLICRR